ncbi:hypothetical protein EXIGLDRAFT_43207 [Exidia glandulosa HHB12029]|uniref:Uncharacterized protein n=1 Tax=Exidia glandulosa HHB12029 TaxID=1314781 RepID=A0A165IJL8_EXIGL|nr:hypothetical protein EXIGLDRAFT_43207 [Exidia glandulosa HHB12029]
MSMRSDVIMDARGRVWLQSAILVLLCLSTSFHAAHYVLACVGWQVHRWPASFLLAVRRSRGSRPRVSLPPKALRPSLSPVRLIRRHSTYTGATVYPGCCFRSLSAISVMIKSISIYMHSIHHPLAYARGQMHRWPFSLCLPVRYGMSARASANRLRAVKNICKPRIFAPTLRCGAHLCLLARPTNISLDDRKVDTLKFTPVRLAISRFARRAAVVDTSARVRSQLAMLVQIILLYSIPVARPPLVVRELQQSDCGRYRCVRARGGAGSEEYAYRAAVGVAQGSARDACACALKQASCAS